MKFIIALMKSDIKLQTKQIRELKDSIKKARGVTASSSQSELHWLRVRARYLFIAYGLSRNVPIEQIEHKESKAYDPKQVEKVIQSYKDKLKSIGLEV
jgi:hypothetical protein